MKLESLAHLAGLSGMVSQFIKPEVPSPQRAVFSIMLDEINMIVKLEGDEEQYKLLLKTAASIYAQIAPTVDNLSVDEKMKIVEGLAKRPEE